MGWQPTGGGGSGSFSGVVAYQATAQTLTTATATALEFDAEVFDTDSYHDNVTNNTRFEAPTTDRYLVIANVEFEPGGADTKRFVHMRVNGNANPRYVETVGHAPASGELTQSLNVGGVFSLSAGDYVEVYARQDSGGDLDTDASVRRTTSFHMVRL